MSSSSGDELSDHAAGTPAWQNAVQSLARSNALAGEFERELEQHYVRWVNLRLLDALDMQDSITTLKECNPSFFVACLERMLRAHLPDIEREPTCVTHHLRNMCSVLRVLQQDILGVDLSYIEPSAIFAGDFNATASLIDVFVTLYGILSGSNAAMAASFSKKSPTIQARQMKQPPPLNRSASNTPLTASRKVEDSFLSSRSGGSVVVMSGARRSRGRISAVSDSSSEVTELTDATPPPHYRKFVADYHTPADESQQPKSTSRRHALSPNRATRLIANAELYNPPFESSAVRVSGRGAVRQTVSSAGNSVNYTLTAALQNRHLQQPPISFDCPKRTRLSLWPVVVTPKKIRPRLSLRPSTSSPAALDYSSDSSDTVPRQSASSALASPSVALGRPIFEPRPRTPLTPREQRVKHAAEQNSMAWNQKVQTLRRARSADEERARSMQSDRAF